MKCTIMLMKNNKCLKICSLFVLISYTVNITCPGSYPCDEVEVVNATLRMCVTMIKVCDGKVDCPNGDDETSCGREQIYSFLL